MAAVQEAVAPIEADTATHVAAVGSDQAMTAEADMALAAVLVEADVARGREEAVTSKVAAA